MTWGQFLCLLAACVVTGAITYWLGEKLAEFRW